MRVSVAAQVLLFLFTSSENLIYLYIPSTALLSEEFVVYKEGKAENVATDFHLDQGEYFCRRDNIALIFSRSNINYRSCDIQTLTAAAGIYLSLFD